WLRHRRDAPRGHRGRRMGRRDRRGVPYAMAYAVADSRLAVGRIDGVVELWNTETARLVKRSRSHVGAGGESEFPAKIAVSNQVVASGTATDPHIRLWHAETGKLLATISDPTYDVDLGYRHPLLELSSDGWYVLTPH